MIFAQLADPLTVCAQLVEENVAEIDAASILKGRSAKLRQDFLLPAIGRDEVKIQFAVAQTAGQIQESQNPGIDGRTLLDFEGADDAILGEVQPNDVDQTDGLRNVVRQP